MLALSGPSWPVNHHKLCDELIGTVPPAGALAPEHAEDTRQYMERVLSSYSA